LGAFDGAFNILDFDFHCEDSLNIKAIKIAKKKFKFKFQIFERQVNLLKEFIAIFAIIFQEHVLSAVYRKYSFVVDCSPTFAQKCFAELRCILE
jgi:tRNA A37 threonylcarbamoyladenosine dehydratase